MMRGMTKSIDHELRYDGATAAQVHAMLADPAFRERVCSYQGVLRQTISIEPQGEGMEVVVDQVQAARGIPSFATKIVGDEINIVQTEHWSSLTAGTVTVVIPGKPGDIKGTIGVTEDGSGTSERVQMSVKVGIPFVGGKLEDLIADLLTKALRAENAVGKEYLAG
jgi:uncharacterized protein DUF2505